MTNLETIIISLLCIIIVIIFLMRKIKIKDYVANMNYLTNMTLRTLLDRKCNEIFIITKGKVSIHGDIKNGFNSELAALILDNKMELMLNEMMIVIDNFFVRKNAIEHIDNSIDKFYKKDK